MHAALLWASMILTVAPLPAADTTRADYSVLLNPQLVSTQPSLTAETASHDISSALRALSQARHVMGGAFHLPDGPGDWPVRALLFAVYDLPLALYGAWAQHEVFGHAAWCLNLQVH